MASRPVYINLQTFMAERNVHLFSLC